MHDISPRPAIDRLAESTEARRDSHPLATDSICAAWAPAWKPRSTLSIYFTTNLSVPYNRSSFFSGNVSVSGAARTRTHIGAWNGISEIVASLLDLRIPEWRCDGGQANVEPVQQYAAWTEAL